MKRFTASTIPCCQFLLFLAALGYRTVFSPNNKGELSVDRSVASSTLMWSARHLPSSLQVGSSQVHHTRYRSEHRARSLVVRCTAPEAFAGRRLNASSVYLLESHDEQHAVVGALSALIVNDLKEEVVVCRSEFCEVLQAESSSHAGVEQFGYVAGIGHIQIRCVTHYIFNGEQGIGLVYQVLRILHLFWLMFCGL